MIASLFIEWLEQIVPVATWELLVCLEELLVLSEELLVCSEELFSCLEELRVLCLLFGLHFPMSSFKINFLAAWKNPASWFSLHSWHGIHLAICVLLIEERRSSSKNSMKSLFFSTSVSSRMSRIILCFGNFMEECFSKKSDFISSTSQKSICCPSSTSIVPEIAATIPSLLYSKQKSLIYWSIVKWKDVC